MRQLLLSKKKRGFFAKTASDLAKGDGLVKR